MTTPPPPSAPAAPPPPPAWHPEFDVLGASWELSLRADGYAHNSVRTYRAAVASLADWLATAHPGTGPLDLGRDHIRGWLVHIRETRSAASARAWLSGVRSFTAWLLAEGETTADPCTGVRTPVAPDPPTPVLTVDQLRRLLATTAGSGFINRRDAAVLHVFVDTGVRLAELAGLHLDDIDLTTRTIFVQGKGSMRAGPRHRAVPVGFAAARALDRYLRDRRRQPAAGLDRLWLTADGHAPLGHEGIGDIVARRGDQAGIPGLHPHVLRHTFASQFRAAGGSEGDLLVLGGWRSRAMLDRYGRSAAAERAVDAARRLSLGDRLRQQGGNHA